MSDAVGLERLRASVQGGFFTDVLRGEVLECSSGRCELQVPITPRIQQYAGFVYGGLVGFVADLGAAWACASVTGPNVTAQMNIHFLAPATGERLLVRGRCIRTGRTLSVGEALVYAVQATRERLAASATVTVVPPPSPRV